MADSKQKRSVREDGLDIIIDILENGKLSHLALKDTLKKMDKDSDQRDKAFLNKLVRGTVERMLTLDYIINLFSKTKVKKMKPLIRNILRMSVYQIIYMDSVPDSAACNEAVTIVKKRKFNNLAPFVNGVLRNISRQKDGIKYPDEKENLNYALSIRYSVPEWMIKRFIKEWGRENTEEMLETLYQGEEGISIRINTSKITFREAFETLSDIYNKSEKQNQTSVILQPKGRNMLKLCGTGDVTRLDLFNRGCIQVQNVSSALVGQISGVKAGDFCIDLCSAPGGKSMHIADLMASDLISNADITSKPADGSKTDITSEPAVASKPAGRIISCDVNQYKTKLIKENIERSGFDFIETKINDATVFNDEWEGKADVVIADVPCSGLGVIGHKPDIKYRLKEEDILELSNISKKILNNAVRYLKKGGKLIFSTCTMTSEENSDMRKYIIEELNMKPSGFKELLTDELLMEKDNGKNSLEGFLKLGITSEHHGFYIAKFEKN